MNQLQIVFSARSQPNNVLSVVTDGSLVEEIGSVMNGKLAGEGILRRNTENVSIGSGWHRTPAILFGNFTHSTISESLKQRSISVYLRISVAFVNSREIEFRELRDRDETSVVHPCVTSLFRQDYMFRKSGTCRG